jgi:hypothetical protein
MKKVEFNAEFVNDEHVIGRWEVVNTVAKKEDFLPDANIDRDIGGELFGEIYFLPEGEDYSLFSWTKGYLKTSSGGGVMLYKYKLEKIDGAAYMFMEILDNIIFVLKQKDKERYTKHELAQRNDIDTPFINLLWVL